MAVMALARLPTPLDLPRPPRRPRSTAGARTFLDQLRWLPEHATDRGHRRGPRRPGQRAAQGRRDDRPARRGAPHRDLLPGRIRPLRGPRQQRHHQPRTHDHRRGGVRGPGPHGAAVRSLRGGLPQFAGHQRCTTPSSTAPRAAADPECCSLVCSIDELCCDFGGTGWDFQCAQLADTACGSTAATASCRGRRRLLSSSREALVCAEDPLCCVLAWDQAFADLAGLLCLDILCQRTRRSIVGLVCARQPDARFLLLPHSTGGCSDPTCCALVCQADPSCCEISWDTSCAKAAS